MNDDARRDKQSPLAARLALKIGRVVPYRLRPRFARLPFLSRLWTHALLGAESQVVTVNGGPLNGSRLELDVAREKAFWLGTHEPLVQTLVVQATLGPDDDSWDIGAHIGFFSLLLARRCRRVIAVEPNRDNALRLRRNVELNGAAVEVVEAAVAAEPGVARLELGPERGTHRLLGSPGVRWSEPGPGLVEEVPTTTLNELLDRFGPPALVKIDIEGGEVDAMRAADNLLRTRPVIICEVHSDNARGVLIRELDKYGYACTSTGSHLVAT
jgi:FkbM family methyltransferase